MQRRRLGHTDIEVSPLALGTWAMGSVPESWGIVDDNESIAAINTAIDAGINLLDTAPIYGHGHAETILGRAVHSRRDQVLIATKCGIIRSPNAKSPPQRRLTKESIVAECEASLRRLATEYIDLYQCHWPDPDTPVRETFEAMETLRSQGKIRAIGLSNYSCEQILAVREYTKPASLQPPLSLLNRRAGDELIPFCREHNIGVIVYSPLAKGLLTGKFTADSQLSGVRAEDPDFLGDRFRRNLEFVEKLRAIAARHGKTPAQLALAWVIQQEGVTSAIVGAKRPSQVTENLGGADLEISPADRQDINRLLEDF